MQEHGKKDEDKKTIYYKSKFSYYITKIKNGEKLTDIDNKELENLVKEDKDNILNLTEPGRLRSIDFVFSFFKDLNIEELQNTILPASEIKKTRKKRGKPGVPAKDYPEELSPKNRLQYIKEHYKLKDNKVKLGKEKMAGYVIFEVEDSDVLIIEKFFQIGKNNNELIPSKGAATYIVHKDANIDINMISLGELVERKKVQEDKKEPKLIEKVNHRNAKTTYYERLDKKFKEIEKNGKTRKEINQDDNSIIAIQTQKVEESNDNSRDFLYDNHEVQTHFIETEPDEITENLEEESVEEYSSEEVDNTNNGYTLNELQELIVMYDAEYREISKKIEELDKKNNQNKKKLERIKENIKLSVDNFMDKDMKEVIATQLQLLEETRLLLSQSEQLLEEVQEKEKANREERMKLAQQFKELIDKGEY